MPRAGQTGRLRRHLGRHNVVFAAKLTLTETPLISRSLSAVAALAAGEPSGSTPAGAPEERSMKRILLSAFVLLCSAPPASAGEARYAGHNGSLMSIEGHAGFVTIRYLEPKPSLWDWGVRPGTLLFEGAWNGPVLVGTAYVFGCGPIPYKVSGAPDANGVLVLRGLAPVVAIWPFCGVIGWEWTGNSTLVFDPQTPPLPRQAAVPPAPGEPPWSVPEPPRPSRPYLQR
jgi:hypothetical protein